MKHKDLQVHHFVDQAEFAAWLKVNWQQAESVWLKIAKKASGQSSPSYEEAREAAIIHGWIDGLINKWDEDFYLLKFSKRRPKSLWSKINREIAESLLKENKLHEHGLAEVERSKADGRWAAAYSVKDTAPPSWFMKALKQHPEAHAFFKTLSKTNQGMIATQLHDAKREETKQKRAAKYLKLLKQGKRPG